MRELDEPARRPTVNSAGGTRDLRMASLPPLLVLALSIGGTMLSVATGSVVIFYFVTVATLVILIAQLAPIVMRRGPHRADVAFFLLVPTVFSVSQNVYLTVVAANLDATELQFVVVTNYVYAVLLTFALALAVHLPKDPIRRIAKTIAQLLLALVCYSAVTVAIFQPNLTGALSSLRNVTSAFVFILIGLYASRWTTLRSYAKLLALTGLLAIGFGFIELYTPDFWKTLDLATLWEKKGLLVSPATQLPPNFFSSERFDGEQIRRMVGPFADPVNWGTFLFVVFIAAWFLRKHLLMLFAAAAAILAVSKGAFLGVLFFAAVWARYHAPRVIYVLIIVVSIVVGGGFYVFTLSSSTGSTSAHIDGLLAAFRDLPAYPLGRGLGGTGVLASRLADTSASDITESGLGLIIGQLGLVGAVIYVSFLVCVAKQVLAIRDARVKTLALAALLGFITNSAFNEVALSPNSSAPYFILIGLAIGTSLLHEDPSSFPIATNAISPSL